MNAQQINAALSQAQNIIAMMTEEEKSWFSKLDQESKFKFMCAFLAGTA